VVQVRWADVTANKTLEAQPWQTGASASILRGTVSTARGVCVSVVLLVGVVGATIPGGGSAQTLRARVIDSELGKPVPGAAVRIGKDGPTLTTDSAGRVVGEHLRAGWTEITVRLIGYEPGVFDLRIPDSGSIEGVFPLDFNGYLLPAVVVEARAVALMPRYNDFESRRQRRMGAYLRWDEIKKRGYSSVGDALRTVRGVRIQCNQQTFECNAVMVRTPQCHPTWYIDGIEVHSFQENTSIIDVYGIEVYRGAGEIPAEFGGSNAACGVIVVWTKSKPYR
jgi:hypothetical protein